MTARISASSPEPRTARARRITTDATQACRQDLREALRRFRQLGELVATRPGIPAGFFTHVRTRPAPPDRKASPETPLEGARTPLDPASCSNADSGPVPGSEDP